MSTLKSLEVDFKPRRTIETLYLETLIRPAGRLGVARGVYRTAFLVRAVGARGRNLRSPRITCST